MALAIFFGYCNNTALADSRTVTFYQQLKDSLERAGYNGRLLVISTKRFGWHNKIQVKASGAAIRSQHLVGGAIDFLVFDLNRDGRSDSDDVSIAYKILDRSIIKTRGGIGTYEHEAGFINRQMIHIDCRGRGARWHR